MTDALTELAADLVRIDSRSSLSNIAIAERIEAELAGFEMERIDYTDAAGTEKRALVAHRGPPGGLAFSGHMDTVPDTGWTDDPWSGRIAGGWLHGLGSADMKGPLAACILAARSLASGIPATLLITTDEETTKQGALLIATRSDLARRAGPTAILVAEPTRLAPVRGHRSHIAFTATATGVQAHSSTGLGRNANWDLIPFLMEMRAIFERLRNDKSLQDPAYDPPFSDFNLVIDNFGAAINVTVPKATARIKYRYSANVDPTPVLKAVREAAVRFGVELEEGREGFPPELPATHPLVALAVELTGAPARTAPYGTDASQFQALAPCLVLGPGDIAVAHTPREQVELSELERAVPLFQTMAVRFAAMAGALVG